MTMRWVLHLLLCAPMACVGSSMEEPTPTPTPPVTPQENWKAETPPQPAECAVDADCVPSSCCASATCGPIATAPNCTGAACPDVAPGDALAAASHASLHVGRALFTTPIAAPGDAEFRNDTLDAVLASALAEYSALVAVAAARSD